jgi:fructosamine-3-kinase
VEATGADAYLSVPAIKERAHTASTDNVLVLEKISRSSEGDSPPDTAKALRNLGMGLATLHKGTFTANGAERALPRYGAARDNFIGLAPQHNCWCRSWGEFFAKYRLEAKVLEIRKSVVRDKLLVRLKGIRAKLIRYLDEHCDGAALLHGDLWSGNAVIDAEGRAWLIDPALYYGDREADLAMTHMFGGFTSDFYEGYDSVFPRSAEYHAKVPIYNLYHFLNHLVLFGEGYMRGVLDGFERMERTVAPTKMDSTTG